MMLGERIGYVVAVRAPKPPERRWLFRCDCGATFEKLPGVVRRWKKQGYGASCPACYYAPQPTKVAP